MRAPHIIRFRFQLKGTKKRDLLWDQLLQKHINEVVRSDAIKNVLGEPISPQESQDNQQSC